MPASPVTTRPTVTSSSRRHVLASLAAVLIGLATVGSTLASTPVTNGYRDQAYGGGAFRPTSDKSQSKLWFTDGSWFAGMFLYKTTTPPRSEYRIHRLNKTTHSWLDTGVRVDTRDKTYADYLWIEGTQTLYVASAYPETAGATDDAIKVFKYRYNATTNVYTPVAGFPHSIPGTASAIGFQGGAASVTITRESTGRLFAVWAKSTRVLYSVSIDDGVSWSPPAQHPAQVANTIRADNGDSDTASVIAFGAKTGVMWSDHDGLPTLAANGYYFSVIAAGANPTVAANWTTQKLPSLVTGPNIGETADNHINLKRTGDGRVFMVGKTGKDTAGCSANKSAPLIEFFQRTAAGTWSAHLVSTVGDCNTRAQLVISDQLNTAWIAASAPNGGGTVYLKSAPLSGPEAFKFRPAADETVQRGRPIIKSATETAIDDVTTAKQNVTSLSGIVVLANNVIKSGTTNKKVYLHAEMGIGATDTIGPVGTVSIAAGKAGTKTRAVPVSVSATDPGSGLSLVRLSNSSALSGGLLTTGTTVTYGTPITWTLTAGEGTKTVYVQWRDAKGNWSAPVSDTIKLDTTPPTAPTAPVHKLSNPVVSKINVHLTWSGGTDTGSGFAGYVLRQRVNGGAWTILGYPTATSANVAIDSAKDYQFGIASRDKAGNVGTNKVGVVFRAANLNEAAPQIAYSGTWATQSLTTFMGGAARISETRGSSATLTFTGNQVAWLSRKSTGHGTANVYVDGTFVGSVNLYSATTLYKQVVFTRTFPTVGPHTLRVAVVGTAGHPRVTIDQFFIAR